MLSMIVEKMKNILILRRKIIYSFSVRRRGSTNDKLFY